MTHLYIIELEHQCWYCGHTQNPIKRLKDHALGFGSAWCRAHKPLTPVVEHFTSWQIPHINDKQVDDFEDILCEALQDKYGLNKVRGGYLVCCGKLTKRPPRDKARKYYLRLISRKRCEIA